MPSIHQSLAAVLGELPAIGKNRRNTQQGFNFRGIDDVLDALNPLLAQHGVFFVPHVLERVTSERTTNSNKAMYEVSLHVQYTFYGPEGDCVVASGWGEGTDMGDKATSKAMTMAMKYVLFQVFAIATEEQSNADADSGAPEETTGRKAPARKASGAKKAADKKAAADKASLEEQMVGWESVGQMTEAHKVLSDVIRAQSDEMRSALASTRDAMGYAWPMFNKAEYDEFLLAVTEMVQPEPMGSLDSETKE